MGSQAIGRAILVPKKKPQKLQYCGAFYGFKIGFYRWDLSSALKLRPLNAKAIPSDTINVAVLD